MIMTGHIQERIKTMFSDLIFDEQRHLYFVGSRRLPSVSSKVEEHVEKFDEKKWLPICAKKEGITEHELKHRWQTINKSACDLGTDTHDYLEHYNGLKTASTPQEKAGVQFLKDILSEYEIVCRELRMYSRAFWYAGTADLLLRHKTTGEFVLADYKTNKDLFKTYGFLLPPFQSMESHPFNKYQIQLSYYQIILEEIGCMISKRLVVYLKADASYRVFETIDLTSHLKDYISNFKKVA
jgi:CRISPR/Cas system-associated exonuclease Cas4 (RecB family)